MDLNGDARVKRRKTSTIEELQSNTSNATTEWDTTMENTENTENSYLTPVNTCEVTITSPPLPSRGSNRSNRKERSRDTSTNPTHSAAVMLPTFFQRPVERISVSQRLPVLDFTPEEESSSTDDSLGIIYQRVQELPARRMTPRIRLRPRISPRLFFRKSPDDAFGDGLSDVSFDDGESEVHYVEDNFDGSNRSSLLAPLHENIILRPIDIEDTLRNSPKNSPVQKPVPRHRNEVSEEDSPLAFSARPSATKPKIPSPGDSSAFEPKK